MRKDYDHEWQIGNDTVGSFVRTEWGKQSIEFIRLFWEMVKYGVMCWLRTHWLNFLTVSFVRGFEIYMSWL